ncbi:MAG TPA: FAD-dependent oxidoreductase [Terracidiphilus sp.]|nr:FAD-dependent oxidoreductase [Terracidiphilus sp.]
MIQELYTARLVHKQCLSESAQCFHFEFALEGLSQFSFVPGQFITAMIPDHKGKVETRAYSLASAPHGNRFELCVNRVKGGYFSNYLADLPDLNVHETIQIYGPNGFFTLREPLTDSIFVATGTGIAPIRGFTQWLFPNHGPDRSQGRQIWLVYGTRHETELYYRQEFEALAAAHPNFHYLPTLSRAPEGWTGLRGYVQEHVAQIIEQRAAQAGQTLPLAPPDPSIPAAELRFDMHAYICGLSPMVTAVRERLKGLGWHRKQIVFERYD